MSYLTIDYLRVVTETRNIEDYQNMSREQLED